MTEQREWHTAAPPWLGRLHPDLAPAPAPETPEERAARLVAELERALAGRVPPALAGHGWGEATAPTPDVDDVDPVVVEHAEGPQPCHLPPRPTCPDCGAKFSTPTALAVHAYKPKTSKPKPRKASRQGNPRFADHETAISAPRKPAPGARRRGKRNRR